MLNSGFGDLADLAFDLYPENLREEIDALNARVDPKLNNGVYRAWLRHHAGCLRRGLR